jgi:hypothetical protein
MYIYLCVASKYVANNSFVALWGLGPFGPIGPGPFGPIEAELIWAHWARDLFGPGPFWGYRVVGDVLNMHKT